MYHLLLVLGAGFAAGAMNALAGGGSFVSLPALIAVGVPSVYANASSTVALYPGGIASVWAYRHGLGPVGMVSLRHLLPITLVGGACGALLLLATPKSAFDQVLPWLLLIATVALAFGNRIGEVMRRYFSIQPAWVLAIQFVLGVYGGYFGGGVGLMMLAVWGLLERRDLKSLNASRTLLVVAANTMAVVIFIAARSRLLARNFHDAAGGDGRRILRCSNRPALSGSRAAGTDLVNYGKYHHRFFRSRIRFNGFPMMRSTTEISNKFSSVTASCGGTHWTLSIDNVVLAADVDANAQCIGHCRLNLER